MKIFGHFVLTRYHFFRSLSLLTPAFLLFFSFSLSSCIKLKFGSEVEEKLDLSTITETSGVWETLIALGESKPEHFMEEVPENLVAAGKELVYGGKASNPETGLPGERISAYFYCTDCHNVGIEDPDLSNISGPIAKVLYSKEHDIPLLQGSTFAGMVNRESWYNGDYAKKYRFSLSVQAARRSLRKAIQLCSRECSQGRDPEPWEEDAMLAYFWTLEWNMSNLGYTSADIADLKRRALEAENRQAVIDEIRSRYAQASPATFGEMPADPKEGYPVEGEPDLETGQTIWTHSCLHCHGAEGASEHYFGDKPDTWESLARKFKSGAKKGVYGLVRLGTHPEEGKRPYMPNYTKERLSDEQIEDLRAYIELRAEGKDLEKPVEKPKAEESPETKSESEPAEKKETKTEPAEQPEIKSKPEERPKEEYESKEKTDEKSSPAREENTKARKSPKPTTPSETKPESETESAGEKGKE